MIYIVARGMAMIGSDGEGITLAKGCNTMGRRVANRCAREKASKKNYLVDITRNQLEKIKGGLLGRLYVELLLLGAWDAPGMNPLPGIFRDSSASFILRT